MWVYVLESITVMLGVRLPEGVLLREAETDSEVELGSVDAVPVFVCAYVLLGLIATV